MSINITDEFRAATTKGKIASAKEVFLTGDTENLQQIGEKTHQLEDSIKNIAATGGASTAAAVTFDNAASGMTAVNAQGAIEELNTKNKAQDTELSHINGSINGFDVKKENAILFEWINSKPLFISKETFITNNGVPISLYDKEKKDSLNIQTSAIVKTDKEYCFVRAMAAGNVDFTASGKEGSIKEYVADNYVPYKYNKLLAGRVDTNHLSYPLGFHMTEILPIINGYSYLLKNISYCVCTYLKEKAINEGSSIVTNTITPETKYVVFNFEDNKSTNDNYASLEIIPLYELQNKLENSPLKLNKEYIIKENFDNLFSLAKYAIRYMYFYGDAVSSEQTYKVQFIKTGMSLRIVIYYEDSKIFDSTVTQDGDKPINTLLSYEQSKLYIIADIRNISDCEDTFPPVFLLSSNAFNKAIPCINDWEAEEPVEPKPIEEMYEKGGHIEDYSKYFETSNGSSLGFVLATNGIYGEGSEMTVTDYILTDKLSFIKAYTPMGSNAGLAFYDADKKALNDYQGTGKAGYSQENSDGSSNYGVWKEIPKEARYMRVTCSPTVNKSLYVIVKDYVSKEQLLEKLSSELNPRNSRVIWGYEGFNMKSPRIELEQVTLNEDAKQIQSNYEQYINRTSFEVSFTPLSDNCFLGIGCAYSIFSEVRVKGNTFSIKTGSSANDTYNNIIPTIIFSDTLPFAITGGKTYKIGYIKKDSSKNGDTYFDGATFYIDDCEENRYEKTIERNADASLYNGVSGRYSTLLLGRLFVSLKQGKVKINNVVFSSDYNPHAKCLLVGDSFVAGDTMVEQGQQYKYAALLQQEIGQNDFVIVGKGGEELNEDWLIQFIETVSKFCPDYVIISLGTNNKRIGLYKSIMGMLTNWLVKVGIKPILVTITPFKYGDNSDYRHEFRIAANDFVRKSFFRYVDINKAVTTDEDGAVWNQSYVFPDGVHPNKEGHKAIYDAFVKELPELFIL